MALAKGSRGTGEPTPKKKKKQPPVPASMGVQRAEGTTATPYQAQPNPVLAQAGYQGDIHSFNRRVRSIVDAHTQRFGYQPGVGLVWDLARAPVGDEELPALFDIPTSFTRARAASALWGQIGIEGEEQERKSEIIRETSMGVRLAEGGAEGGEGFFKRQQDSLVLDGLRQAIQSDELGSTIQYDAYVKAHADDLNRILKDPVMAELFVKLEQSSRNNKKGMPDLGEMQVAGYGLEPNIPLILKPFEAASQIGMSLVMAPAGFLQVGGAVVGDTRDIFGGDFTPSRSIELGKQVGKGVAESYRDPANNAGYIFLDVLGAGSVVAGTGARIAAVGRAARVGAPTRAKVMSFLRRPDPGRAQLRVGEMVVEKNLSDNALLRGLQRMRATRLQRRLDEARVEDVSGFQREFSRPRREIRKLVSPEATVRRLSAQRLRVERILDDTLRRELLALAGPSVETSHVFKRLPKNVRRGLTRGEEKAIFIHASDLPGSFSEKAAVWRAYHERQIDKAAVARSGIDVKAHDRHLRDITLAEQAMQKPRKRFNEALRVSREVSEAQELIKIRKFGLDPVDAEGRIAALGAIARGEDFIPGEGVAITEAGPKALKPVIPESWYVPTVPKAKAKKPVTTAPSPRPGEFGVAAPRIELPELKYRFEGKAIHAGGIRVDTTHLLADTYGRVVRAASKVDQFDNLWKASVEAKVGENYVALLPKGQWPDELREKLRNFDEGAVVGREIEALTDADLEKFWDGVVLDPKKAAKVPGVRWVDEALIPEHVYYPKGVKFFGMLGAAINEPIKIGRLFTRPAYALNALGNVGMNLIETVAAPKHVTRAVAVEKRNPKLARTIAALNGEGKMVALNPQDFSVQRFSHAMGRVWGAFTDRAFRNANFYYWAERKGYKTDEDIERLVATNAPENVRKDLVEIVERGNKGMVDFRNQSPVERNIIRHWIFVYPWLSRSFVWGVRTMFEHPVKTWTLSELGQVGAEKAEEFYQAAGEALGIDDPQFPDWFRRGGYFPVATDDAGNPQVVNANNINSFATLNDFLNTGRSMFAESPYDGPEDILSPAAEFGLYMFGGGSTFGADAGRVQTATGEMLGHLPQVLAVERAGEEADPSAPPLERPPFIPGGFWNSYGPLLVSGLSPRSVDLEAMEARYWRDADKEDRTDRDLEERRREKHALIKDEIRTMRAFEQVAEQVLGRRMPAEVRESLSWQEKFTYDYADFSIENGREPTPAEKRVIEIDRLQRDGRITPQEADELRLGAGLRTGRVDPEKLEKWTLRFRADYLNSEAVADWYDDRNLVLDVANNARKHFRFLRGAGLWKGEIPVAPQGLTKKNLPGGGLGTEGDSPRPTSGYDLSHPLYQYARKYVDYDKQARRRDEQGAERGELETIRSAADRAWRDEQDRNVSVKGKKLPSFVRLDWALKDERARSREIAVMATAGWDTLSDFEKETLGRKSTAKASYGWLVYHAIADALRGNITTEDVQDEDIRATLPDALPFGQRSIDSKTRRAIARHVDRYFVQGFQKDFIFSEKPKYQRLQVLPVVTKSRYAKDWNEIFQVANQANSALVEGQITKVQEAWDEYARTSLIPWIQTDKPEGFQREIKLLGGLDLLQTLID